MTDAEERLMYENNRAAWAEYAAPRWVAIMERDSEVKQYMWADACPELRAAIRALVKKGEQM